MHVANPRLRSCPGDGVDFERPPERRRQRRGGEPTEEMERHISSAVRRARIDEWSDSSSILTHLARYF